MEEAKKRVKSNPPKNAQEAWEKLDKAIQEIRQDFLLKK